MLEYSKVKYYELLHSENDRAVRSITNLSVKVRQLISKISQILLKLDCLPLEQSKCPNDTLCHYKISDAMYHMASIVEKYGRITQEICSQNELDSNETFEEYISLSRMRVDCLKTITRRLSAVSDNVRRIFAEIVQEDEDTDEQGTESESAEELGGSFTGGRNDVTFQ